MKTTTLNPSQIHLLQMFQLNDSPKALDELKSVLYEYYSKKMRQSLNQLWNKGTLNQKRLDEINQMNLHNLS